MIVDNARFRSCAVLSLIAVEHLRRVAIAGITLFWATISLAQQQATLTFVPSTPTSTDVIHVTAFTGVICQPVYANDGVVVQRNGADVSIVASLSKCLFGTPPPPYQFEVDIGPLEVGTHLVTLSWQRSDDGIHYIPMGVLTTSTLVVQPGIDHSIPTLSTVGIAVLIALLCLIVVLQRPKRSRSAPLLVLVFAAYQVAHSSPAAASDQDDPFLRELIVLFDPTDPTSPTVSQILAAVADPSSNPELNDQLGHPVDARQSAAGLHTSSARLAELEKDPLSPRALVEKYVVLVYADQTAAAANIDKLWLDKRLLSAERNRRVHFSAVPSDTYFSYVSGGAGTYQWGSQLLNLPAAWDRVHGTAYIAALDNGIYCVSGSSPCTTHPDLQQNLRVHFSSASYGGVPSTSIDETAPKGHGTHVAGIMAATPEYGSFSNGQSNTGVAGTCWTCSLIMFRYGGGGWQDSALGMTYLIDEGAEAINLSFGDEYDLGIYGVRYSGDCTVYPYAQFCNQIALAKTRDVVLVAASGNGYASSLQFPAKRSETIAVGGIESSGGFFRNGYGNGTACTAGVPGPECGSNYGLQEGGANQVVAPAKDVVSTFYFGNTYNSNVHCGDTYGPNSGTLATGYGDCTGTSMSTPFVTGVVGLVRSINPLLSRDDVKSLILASTFSCVGTDASLCGAGIVDAAKAVNSALGGPAVKNRLTPLFSFYSSAANDHFYTIVPNMALAAMTTGGLNPQPPGGPIVFSVIGAATPGYSQFPCSGLGCLSYGTPSGMLSVFTTHVNPIAGLSDLSPLYRLSYSCSSSCSHTSHAYSTSATEVAGFVANGYKLDGIEGYVYPKAQTPPTGAVKLCRQYNSARDDYIIYPGTGATGTTCATGDGYTKNGSGVVYTDYNYYTSPSDYIGWAYPLRPAQTICSNGVPCNLQALFLFDD